MEEGSKVKIAASSFCGNLVRRSDFFKRYLHFCLNEKFYREKSGKLLKKWMSCDPVPLKQRTSVLC